MIYLFISILQAYLFKKNASQNISFRRISIYPTQFFQHKIKLKILNSNFTQEFLSKFDFEEA